MWSSRSYSEQLQQRRQQANRQVGFISPDTLSPSLSLTATSQRLVCSRRGGASLWACSRDMRASGVSCSLTWTVRSSCWYCEGVGPTT